MGVGFRDKLVISIHALRGEGDDIGEAVLGIVGEISIHALRGEGDVSTALSRTPLVISIHALRGEGDLDNILINIGRGKFQSTPSVGRATRIFLSTPSYCISIHALRGEGDGGICKSLPALIISIHALRGEGDTNALFMCVSRTDISIHALRGEGDEEATAEQKISAISIHALRGEGDNFIQKDKTIFYNFNPRPPWGGRPSTVGSVLT